MGSMSIWHWLIVLVVVVLVFGTKKLGNMVQRHRQGRQGLQGWRQGRGRQAGPPRAAVASCRQTTIDVETKEKTKL
jgi:sec-independent protein translocase protein TatA